MKYKIRWIVVGIILSVLIGLGYNFYFSEHARIIRKLERENRILRLMVEQRELQYRGLQLNEKLGINPKQSKEQQDDKVKVLK